MYLVTELNESLYLINVFKSSGAGNKISRVSGRLRCARAPLRATQTRRERAFPAAAAVVERRARSGQAVSQSVTSLPVLERLCWCGWY